MLEMSWVHRVFASRRLYRGSRDNLSDQETKGTVLKQRIPSIENKNAKFFAVVSFRKLFGDFIKLKGEGNVCLIFY